MSKDQVLSSETSAPPEKPIDLEEISGNQKSLRSQIIVTANGLEVKSNLNPNALEFYPTWILPKVAKDEGHANLVVKEKSIEIKRPCHYEIIQEVITKNDSLVEIIERPEKGLKVVENVVVEEIIERKFSEVFEKSFENLTKENNEEEEEEIGKCKEVKKVVESIKCEMTTKCEKPANFKENKDDLKSNKATTLKTKDILVKSKQVHKEENNDPQVLFFGPATVKQTDSSSDLKQNTSDIETSTKVESVDEVIAGQYSDNAIIENTVVGDHTEAKKDIQINQVNEKQIKKDQTFAPTSTTKIKDKICNSRIALSGTLKGLERNKTMTAGNVRSTGTVKKLLSSTIPTTKETKVVFSASTARSCLITPRKPSSALEEKKKETLTKCITPSNTLVNPATNTKRTNLQTKSSLISSNNFIKRDVMAKSKTKDSLSLRSSCSTDKNSLSSKSSLSSTAKVSPSKVVEKVLTKSSTKPLEKGSGLKRTDYLTRSPGGTVSSNLRKTETQKRQNLFPDSDAIKMTDTLFK